jgi:hypothetical protein
MLAPTTIAVDMQGLPFEAIAGTHVAPVTGSIIDDAAAGRLVSRWWLGDEPLEDRPRPDGLLKVGRFDADGTPCSGRLMREALLRVDSRI